MAITGERKVLEISRWFDAQPARVFAAWLTREAFQAWIGPVGMPCDVPVLDAQIGGRYQITMRLSDGNVIPVSGIFHSIEAPHRLVFTWGWDGDPSRNSLITVTLRAERGGTELTLRQDGLPDANTRDQHEKGWSGTLTKLVQYLDKGAAL